MATSDDAPDGVASASTHQTRVTYKDMSDMMGRLERDLNAGQSRVEGKLDAFIISHHQQHSVEVAKLNDHLLSSAIMGEKSRIIDARSQRNEQEIDSLREWRAEVRGITTLVKFAIGTSLIGAIVSILTLVNLIQAGI